MHTDLCDCESVLLSNADHNILGDTVRILGQFFTSQPPPAPLPGAGALERYVLDSPVALMLVLFLGALAALVVCRAIGQPRRGMIAALVLVAMAGCAWMASTLIETDRETIKRGSRELIAAVATVDVRELDRLLADNAMMRYRFSRGDIGKEAIISQVVTRLGGQYPIKSHAVLQSQASLTEANVGRSQIQVHAVSEMGAALTSWWRLDWVRESGGRWRVTRISPLHDSIRSRR